MTARPRWDRCVSHRGQEADAFIRDYFSQTNRESKLIAGAGFDPRSTRFAEFLAAVAGDRVSGIFLREQRPDPPPELVKKAEHNEERLRELIPSCSVERFEIFDIEAPVGGRRATSVLNSKLSLDRVTDIIVDCSALSVGVFFPIVKYCFERAHSFDKHMNLHLLVLDDPMTDGAIKASPCHRASPLHSFQGRLNLDAFAGAAKLWLPQLGRGRREVLRLVHQYVNPHAVCPILPFPAAHPRHPDELIEEYGDLFEAISDPLKKTWQVDARDLVYAHEKSPLDLYRTILRIDDARRRVFEQTGGSQVILSPVGSKALALGMLMAAIERDFAVVSVESIAYKPDSLLFEEQPDSRGEFVHIWLCGEAYEGFANTEVNNL